MSIEKIIYEKAEEIQDELVRHRRYLHENPELGFDLENTVAYVMEELKNLGYDPKPCGKAGVVASVGKKEGRVFLIRGDMDALPIIEKTDLEFKSTNDNMHACGHDFHTAMMLGAAKILKDMEDEIEGQVKLMFQPAEETLEGAKDMIENGLLEDPKVDAGMMMHVVSGIDVDSGKIIIPSKGVFSSASDNWEIRIEGKGGHGAMPENTIDPINVGVHIYQAFQNINSREVSMSDELALTFGQFIAGNSNNIIPAETYMSGTLRTFNRQTREFVKSRMEEITEKTADLFGARAKLTYTSGTPSVVNDEDLVEFGKLNFEKLLGKNQLLIADEISPNQRMSGSEDFGYLSEQIPTLMLSLTAGSTNDGHLQGLHHPEVTFDEEALKVGAAVYAYGPIKWLKENK